MNQVESSLNLDLSLLQTLRPCLRNGVSWRAGVGRVRSLAILSILRGCSPLVPDVQAIKVFAVPKWFSRRLLDLSRAISLILVVAWLAGCGEPVFENAGSPNSLLEDREACVMEMEKSPAAIAYRKNPTAHPDYVSQVFTDMNQCIERKGWKQVRSLPEQEQVREATTSELAHTSQPVALSDPKAREALVQAVEDRLARVPSSTR